MANGKQTLLLLLLLLAVLYSVESLSSIQVCGSQLSETIYAVCKGKFMPIHQYKRGACEYMLQQCVAAAVATADWL